jgi:hypothetical protein
MSPERRSSWRGKCWRGNFTNRGESNTDTAWRQELARRDSIFSCDELQAILPALTYAQLEELRAKLLEIQKPPAEEDATTLAATKRELDALLPWISTEGLRCLVRVARAFAEKR